MTRTPSALLFSTSDLGPTEFDHTSMLRGSRSWWHDVADLGPLVEDARGNLLADVRTYRFHRDMDGTVTRTLCTTGRRAIALS